MHKRFRFLHAADLHLDSPFRGIADVAAPVAERLRQSTFDALSRLIDLAVRAQVDFVLLCGDVYDAADRSLRAQIRFQKAMDRLAERGIPVFVIHGNHDPADGVIAGLSWPDSVRFFSPLEPESLPVVTKDRGLVARVYGMSYATAAVTDNLALRYRKLPDAPYHIAMLHANVDGADDHANYAPCTTRELTASGMDYWALGHIHGRRVLHERPWIVYPGNTQGRSVRETGAKGCYLVDVNEAGETSLRFEPLDAARWETIDVPIDGIQTMQQLKERLETTVETVRGQASGRASVVRLSTTGRGPMHAPLQAGTALAELTAELREDEELRAQDGDFVWIESLRVRSGVEADVEALLAQPNFLGDVLRLAEAALADEAVLARLSDAALQPLAAHAKAAAAAGIADPRRREEWMREARELAVELLLEAGWES